MRLVASILPWLPALALAAPDAGVRVRATEAAAPCAAAAVRAFAAAGGGEARVLGEDEAGAPADVIVASGPEMTRALESGAAVDGTEVDVARVPWVLSARSGDVRRLADLAGIPGEVWIPAGAWAYEARRELAAVVGERLRQTADVRRLREAATTVVPLSLAPEGARAIEGIPALEMRAAVLAGAARVEAAGAFVRFLGSETGQDAFARCR